MDTALLHRHKTVPDRAPAAVGRATLREDLSGPKQPGRLVWMDRLRGLAIVLVVAFHGRSVLTRFLDDLPPTLYTVLSVFAPFRMPLLMFLSGMLLSASLAKPLRDYFKGKARAIAWPYLVWSLCFLAVAGQLSPGRVLQIIWEPPPHLWYLSYLLVFYLLAFVLVRLRIPLPAVLGGSLLGSLAVGEGKALRFVFLFCFFLGGHLYVHHAHRLRIVHGRTATAFGAVVVATGAAASAVGVDLKYAPSFALVPVAGIALCLLVAPRFGAGRLGRAFAYVGRHSIVFYVTHFVVLWVVYRTLHDAGWREPLSLYAIGMATSLLVGLALSRARARDWRVDALFCFPSLSSSPQIAGPGRNKETPLFRVRR